MSRILIAYSTREGQTRSIAASMAEALEHQGHTVHVTDVREPEPGLRLDEYEAVLLGGSIHLGRFDRGLKGFVFRHRGELAAVPAGFFTVCLAASSPDDGREEVMAYAERFFDATSWRPNLLTFVPGALLYRRYNFVVRFVMRGIARSTGLDTDTSRDWVYTDYDATRAWATQAVDALLGAEVTPPLFCSRRAA